MQQAKNQVSTIVSPSRPPAPLSIALDMALSRAANQVDNGKIPEGALPSGARVALEARLKEFDTALQPASADRIRAIVGSLSTMPARVEDDLAKQRFMVEQFVAICSDVPEWALSKAALAFLRHEIGSGFFPQAGELRKHALRFVGPLEASRQKIAGVLSARVIPDAAASRERVAQGFKSLADSIGAREFAALAAAEREAALAAKVDSEDARKESNPIERARIVAHHESRLAALSAEYASNPLPDCSALMKREGEYEGGVK